ncbi:MAG TPA: mechanosensitive ion channel family protein [Stellaceae bacterium]|nr:mechanosensitive ion channel family protein [Stellaceae bacterium]
MIDSLIDFASVLDDRLLLAGVVILIGFAVTRFAFKSRPVGRFISHLAFFIGFTIVLVLAGVVPYLPTPSIVGTTTYLVVSVYKVVWWVAACRLLVGFIRAFMILETQPRETRLQQDLLAGLIYLGAFFAIVANVFDIPVSGLVATSGVIAIILGLALQSTLGDVFSGIVLNLAKPYRPGDWVIFDGETQGKVVEMNWRETQIVTGSNDLAIVPNSAIAKSKLVNLGQPNKAHGMSIRLGIEPTALPSTICTILESALLSSNRILHTPRPTVTIKSLNAVSMDCELYFFVSDISASSNAQNELFDLVQRHCLAAGIRLAPPPGTQFAPTLKFLERDSQKAPQRLLGHLAIFAPLTEEERASLAAKMQRQSCRAGETIVEAGSALHALFIVRSGVLVASRKEGEREVELRRLSPGDWFGEASVLTGAVASAKLVALTNAVLYEISKDNLAPIFKARPTIATELGQILARREATQRERLEQLADHGRHQEDLAEWLATRMKSLFHLNWVARRIARLASSSSTMTIFAC